MLQWNTKKQQAQVKETVIGFTPEPSKTSKRNQKRREKKKNPQDTENDKEEDSTQPDNSPEEEQQEDVVDYQKKIKAITKKLRQISDLKQQQKNGKTLEKSQLEKLVTESQLVAELKALEQEWLITLSEMWRQIPSNIYWVLKCELVNPEHNYKNEHIYSYSSSCRGVEWPLSWFL